MNTLEVITVRADNREDLNHQLSRGEKLLQTAAAASRSQGILITRHGPHHYTIRLSENVPFGLTRTCHD